MHVRINYRIKNTNSSFK